MLHNTYSGVDVSILCSSHAPCCVLDIIAEIQSYFTIYKLFKFLYNLRSFNGG